MRSAPSEGWIQRTCGRWRWRVDPRWSGLLDGRELPDWLDLAHDPRAQRVKANDGRQVWRVRVAGGELFVKVGWPGRRWARWRQLLLGCDADRERRIAEYASAHGIDAVRPIAVADARIDGRQPTSVFVTLGLPGARPLNECWESLDPKSAGSRRVRNGIIEAVARLIALAHQNGLEHFDLHAGNVLIQDTPTGPRALFVDLNNIRTGRPVRDRGVIRNLAQLNQWFRAHAPLTDRVRFLNRYLHWHEALRTQSRYGRRLAGSRRELLDRLDRAARRHAAALYAKRDRRILRTGRYFARVDLGRGWRAHVFLASKHEAEGSPASGWVLTAAQWRDWLGDPAARLQPADPRHILKQSRSTLVCRTRIERANGEALEVVCKRFRPRSRLGRMAGALRAGRAMRAWKRGNALLHRQIPTPRPLAVVERRRLGLLLDSFIVSEYLPYAQDLDTLLTVSLRPLPAGERRRVKRQVTDSLAALIRRLHERGLTHRDLKAPNVLVQWDRARGEPARTLLVDLDGLRLTRRATGGAELDALARLNVSVDHCKSVTVADRARFLVRYLTRVGCPQPRWKPTWRVLAALCDAKRRARRHRQEKMLEKYGRV